MLYRIDEFIDRRTALVRAAAAVSAGALWIKSSRSADPASTAEITDDQVRTFLKPLLLPREDVELWLNRKDFPFCKYDPELGYLHVDRDFAEGLNGAICSYRYDELDARQTIAHAGRPCRINTYGNSFTSCEQ